MLKRSAEFRSLSGVLDDAERSGRLNLRTAEIVAALPHVTPDALRQALHRQQKRGRIVRISRGAGHWLIVPLRYATVGAPPLEVWLDQYVSRTLRTPYYVGLLSAAETYGASPYAVMVTQVMVAKPRRPIIVGRHELVFHTRAHIERVPTRWHETEDGRFKVSTPELTALELLQRDKVLGGLQRVVEVLRALWETFTNEGLAKALNASQDVRSAQRLGALLAMDEQEELASQVARWLRGKHPRIIPLESGQPQRDSGNVDSVFKVRLPIRQQGANT